MADLGAAFGLAAVAALLAMLAIHSPRKPGYSQIGHTISELGERGARDAGVISLWFLAVGVCILGFSGLIVPALPDAPGSGYGMVLFAAMGASYALAGLFRVDPGAPGGGSLSNILHNLAGGLGYALPAAGLWLLAPVFAADPRWTDLAWLANAAGWASAAVLAGFVVPVFRNVRGAVQRAGEAVVCVWVVAVAWRILAG